MVYLLGIDFEGQLDDRLAGSAIRCKCVSTDVPPQTQAEELTLNVLVEQVRELVKKQAL